MQGQLFTKTPAPASAHRLRNRCAAGKNFSGRSQAGSFIGGIIGFAGFCFLMYVAFLTGTKVANDIAWKSLDIVLGSSCDKPDVRIWSSTKAYSCFFARDLTPEEIEAHKKETEDMWKRSDK